METLPAPQSFRWPSLLVMGIGVLLVVGGITLKYVASPSPHSYIETFVAAPATSFGALLFGAALLANWGKLVWGARIIAVGALAYAGVVAWSFLRFVHW